MVAIIAILMEEQSEFYNSDYFAGIGDWSTTFLLTRGGEYQPGACHVFTPNATLSKGKFEGLRIRVSGTQRKSRTDPSETGSWISPLVYTVHFTDQVEKVRYVRYCRGKVGKEKI